MELVRPTDFKSEREVDRFEEFKLAFKISSEGLIGPLFPLFWAIDLLLYPAHIVEFGLIRLSVTALCYFLAAQARKAMTIQRIEMLSVLLILYPCWTITYMSLKAGGAAGPYYAGLGLICSGGIFFFPWRRKSLLQVILSMVAPYAILGTITLRGAEEGRIFASNLAFLSAAITIAVVIRYIYEKLKIREIEARVDLKREISDREEVIQLKSLEAIRTASLAKQFSPQIVKAIASGELEITKGIRRSKICVLFVDIVNSTNRAAKIDKDDLNKVISQFIDDSFNVLLKYDLTIDKFLGDGILAFSNSPVEQSDFIERAVAAALELRATIQANRLKYIEHWLNELQVRIGISVGFANVGFYGPESVYRAFTAIGLPVNLASRICSSAEPGQILISQDVARGVPAGKFTLREGGLRKLKGFEDDIIKVFSVDPNFEQSYGNMGDYCPSGHGPLALDVNEKGIYNLSCKVCGYIPPSAGMEEVRKVA